MNNPIEIIVVMSITSIIWAVVGYLILAVILITRGWREGE